MNKEFDKYVEMKIHAYEDLLETTLKQIHNLQAQARCYNEMLIELKGVDLK